MKKSYFLGGKRKVVLVYENLGWADPPPPPLSWDKIPSFFQKVHLKAPLRDTIDQDQLKNQIYLIRFGHGKASIFF